MMASGRKQLPLQPIQPHAPGQQTTFSSGAHHPQSQPSVAAAKTRTVTHSSAPLPPSSVRAHPPPPPPSSAAAAATEARDHARQPPPKESKKPGKLTEQWQPPPAVILRGDARLTTGALLGEGGFARVYVATESNGVQKALKVISKEQLKSTKNRSKLFGEIKIHQAMKHPNIITFEHCFEDTENVYMQLELCAHGSFLDLLRKRRRYSEPETRFYLVQLIGACEYMHSNSVIHRDLKLGNLMLDAHMNLRVGDFGLAALVKFPGERKKTICGTPNYIAPEILFDTTNGHSFEVDIWSLGVIMYTLLVGKPPFQTKDVKNIYRKIKDNNYTFPEDLSLSEEAMDLIADILTTKPAERPTLAEVLQHPFFTCGPFPSFVPNSAMYDEPDFSNISFRQSSRNFKDVLRSAGLQSVVPATNSTASSASSSRRNTLDRVDEGDDEYVSAESNDGIVAKQPEDVDTNRMEHEVRKVLQPESPIAELLKSARKPLIISPNSSEPRDLLRRRQSLKDSPLSGQQPTREKENSRLQPEYLERKQALMDSPLASASARERGKEKEKEKESDRPQQQAAETITARDRPTIKSDSSHQTTTSNNTASAQPKTTILTASMNSRKPSSASTVPPSPKPVTTSAGPEQSPRRELYATTWRALDEALSTRTSAALDDYLCQKRLSLSSSSNTVEAPKVFIMSWVDYTHKYGTAYCLSDGSAGVFFNDSSTMVLSPDKNHFDYVSYRKGNVYSRRHYTVDSYPEQLARKTYLLSYFEVYMSKSLLRDVDCVFSDKERKTNMDFLVKYYRMKNAVVFKLSNDIIQFNFFDHTKVLLSQRGNIVTFIDVEFKLETFYLHDLLREAFELGYLTPHNFLMRPLDRKPVGDRVERLRCLSANLDKLASCRDILKYLSSRKPSTTTTTTSATVTSSAVGVAS